MPLFPRSWQNRTGYVQIMAAALMWGSYGLFIRALPYPSELIVFFRFLFGLIGLLLVALARRDYACFKPVPAWKRLALAGVLSSFSWLAYTYSLAYTSVANAVFLTYTYPVFVILLAPLMLKERVEKRSIWALAVSLAGIAAIMGRDGLFGSGSVTTGDWSALGGGIMYALFLLVLKGVPPGMLGFVSNVIISTVICLIAFPLALPSLHLLDLSGAFILVLMGILLQCGASTLYHLGLRTTRAQHACILTYVDPFSATILAALFLREPLYLFSLGGGLLIMAGGIIVFTCREPLSADADLEQALG